MPRKLSGWKRACIWSKKGVFCTGLNICRGWLSGWNMACFYGEKRVFSIRVLIYAKGGNMVYLWSKEGVFSKCFNICLE